MFVRCGHRALHDSDDRQEAGGDFPESGRCTGDVAPTGKPLAHRQPAQGCNGVGFPRRVARPSSRKVLLPVWKKKPNLLMPLHPFLPPLIGTLGKLSIHREKAETTSPGFLGFVHGEVSALQELLGSVAILGAACNPDTGRDGQLRTVYDKWLTEAVDDALGQSSGVI